MEEINVVETMEMVEDFVPTEAKGNFGEVLLKVGGGAAVTALVVAGGVLVYKKIKAKKAKKAEEETIEVLDEE